MTDHRAHHHDDQTVDRRLAQHQHALTSALDDVLDVEAGLREILIHSRQDTAADDLDTVLDTEAGLAAILPPTPEPAAPPSTHRAPHDHTGAQELLRTLSPSDRMTLRDHPHVKQAFRDLARDHDFLAPALIIVRPLNLILDLAFDLARDLNRDLDLALLGRRLNRNLGYARDFAGRFAHNLDGSINRDFQRARARARYINRLLDLALSDDHASDRDFRLDHDLDFQRARARARDLNSILDLALARASDLDLDHASEAARTVVRTVVDVRTTEVGRAIGAALRREPPMLDKNSLHTLLDDFTTADLSDVDLTGMDLSGVHWSERGTQWPPVLDVEDLKARSDETPRGSGTWIVRSGTASIRDPAEL